MIAEENKAKTLSQIKFVMAINSSKTSFFIIKLLIERSQTKEKLQWTPFLDPVYIMLIKKKYFEDPFFLEYLIVFLKNKLKNWSLRIILSSLNVLLCNWEFFIKYSDFNNHSEGKIYYLLNLVKNFLKNILILIWF